MSSAPPSTAPASAPPPKKKIKLTTKQLVIYTSSTLVLGGMWWYIPRLFYIFAFMYVVYNLGQRFADGAAKKFSLPMGNVGNVSNAIMVDVRKGLGIEDGAQERLSQFELAAIQGIITRKVQEEARNMQKATYQTLFKSYINVYWKGVFILLGSLFLISLSSRIPEIDTTFQETFNFLLRGECKCPEPPKCPTISPPEVKATK